MAHTSHISPSPSGLEYSSARRRRITSSRSTRRRGVESVEVMVALPVLVIVTLAIFQFGILMLIYQAVVTATVEGAREAGKGGNINAVATVINQILVPHGVVVSSTSTDANIVVEQSQLWIDPMQPPPPPIVTMLNTNPCYPPTGVPLSTAHLETRVTFSLSLVPTGGVNSAWGTRQGVPNWLSVFGFSLAGKRFEVSSLVRTE